MDLLKKVSSLLGIPDKIAGAVYDVLSSTGTRLWSVEEDAVKLRRIEARIRALLTDAEQRRFVVDGSVRLWLRELRAVAFDADILLDRLDTITAVSRTVSEAPSRKRKRFFAVFQLGLRQRWELASSITKIKERLDEISEDRKKFRFQDGDARRTAAAAQPEHRHRLLEAASLCDQRPIGRVDETGKILAALVSDSTSTDVPVISILGMPGIGKTTIAKLLYGHQEVQVFFSVRIWVWLPDVCDASTAMKRIIEAVTGTKCDLLSLDMLQRQLRDLLSQRRFLLVIDNLWEESYQFWESLRPSLMAGMKGSKVLITTRNETVSRMMSNIILHVNLKGLDVEEFWRILQVYAFSGSMSEEQQQHLESIGRRIAETCQGSPLVAKSFGVLLAGVDRQKEQWEDILSEMQILEDDKNTNIILENDKNNNIILASLLISYRHLPYHLKQCFAFCSILPIDLEFEKDEVVRLWIAEGLVTNNGRRRAEMVAGSYFDELLWRSFFEASSSSHPNQKKYRVPSLMLDLARYVSKYESLTVDPDKSWQDNDHPDWIRYATILCPKDEPLAFDRIERYESLRFLKLCPKMNLHSNQIPSGLPSKLTCLRTLDLSYTKLEILPTTVGCLIHLRYLGLRGTSIGILPEEVCNLFNLQTLDLTDCYKLMDLSAGMSRLINMRHLCLHLDWDKVFAFRSMPSGIDKLESLQTLSRFVVVPNDGAGKCNISELKNLKIRGELCILKLEGTTGDGAREANMSAKEYIHKLMLKWSDSAGTCTDERQIEESEKVIEALCPHRNLKRLRIENYPGRTLPNWVQMFSPPESLEIISCPRLN